MTPLNRLEFEALLKWQKEHTESRGAHDLTGCLHCLLTYDMDSFEERVDMFAIPATLSAPIVPTIKPLVIGL